MRNLGQTGILSVEVVPKVRLELTRGYPHYALNVARLPIPPLRQVTENPIASWLAGGRYWTRTSDLLRVKQALVPTELTARHRANPFGQSNGPADLETSRAKPRMTLMERTALRYGLEADLSGRWWDG